MGKIRSALRDISRWWKPIKAARDRVRLGKGKNAMYRCEQCFSLVDKIEIDHVVEAGSLKDYNDLPGFCERLFVEDPLLLMALCTSCHSRKTRPPHPLTLHNSGS